jgi:hypothetical protein
MSHLSIKESTWFKILESTRLGCQFLRGTAHVFRVRVIADLEFRIKASIELMNCGRDDAVPAVARQVERVKEIVSEVGIGSDWYG